MTDHSKYFGDSLTSSQQWSLIYTLKPYTYTAYGISKSIGYTSITLAVDTIEIAIGLHWS